MASPIIIVGAPRSGTKMVRSILASHPDTAVFPSEIDFIWRCGSENYPDDAIPPDYATPAVISHIRSEFDRLSRRHHGARVVEKSVANSLRLDYVYRIFPDAFFIHILRDGRASTESAYRNWAARAPASYVLQKLKGIDMIDALALSPQYLRYHYRRFRRAGEGGPVPGPQFPGYTQVAAGHTFLDVCAIQWKECVQAIARSWPSIPDEQKAMVRYEALVDAPLAVTQDLFAKSGLSFPEQTRQYIERSIRQTYRDRWQERLSSEEIERVQDLIGPELHAWNYVEVA